MIRPESVMLLAPLLLTSMEWREREPLPVPRAGYIVGVSGKRMLLAGGSYWENGQKILSDRSDFFDPAANRWTPGPALPAPRCDVAVATLRDSVYVFGGVVNGALTDSVLRFDGKAWREAGKLPQPLMYATIGVVGDRVFLFGGLTGMGDLGTATKTLWSWKPGTEWKKMAEFPGSSRVIAAVTGQGGKLYVFGGLHKSATELKNLNEAWSYDVAGNHWTRLPDLPVARRAWSAVSVGASILLLGGYTDDFSAEIYSFDPATGGVKAAGTLPHALADAKYVLIGKRLLTAGGESGVKIRSKWTLETELKETR